MCLTHVVIVVQMTGDYTRVQRRTGFVPLMIICFGPQCPLVMCGRQFGRSVRIFRILSRRTAEK